MIDRNSKIYCLLKIMSILFGIQIIRITIRQAVFYFFEQSIINNDLITILEMVLFAVFFLFISKKKNINLSIFPDIKSKGNLAGYSIATLAVVFIIVTSPIFNGDSSINVIVALISSVIVTPIFEELIFRGYVWNELEHHYKNEFTIYIISTLLFAIWHLGYFDIIYFRLTLAGISTGLTFVMFMKVITGLCFGIIIGLVRYKFKNCYSAILVHSFMNIFGR